ncbi:MAG: cytochrome C oxidase subunit IV family protein [Dehalococcoidia bacterium]|nr:cytochrome C oxidase subunit IV family protein [Dehalococcoidia bacterium]
MNRAMRVGINVAIILAVLTVLEYIFAVSVEDDLIRFLGLTVTAIGKVILICWYFMHFGRMFKQETHA